MHFPTELSDVCVCPAATCHNLKCVKIIQIFVQFETIMYDAIMIRPKYLKLKN